MSEHPGDSATNRFRAFWAGLLAFVSFGVVLWIALKAAGPKEAIEPGWAERAEERSQNVAAVLSAQAEVLPADAIDKAMAPTLAALQKKKAAKTELVVPGSPTFMKQSQAPAATEEKKPEAAEAKPAAQEEKPAAAEKPAAEEKAAVEKPAAPKAE